MLLGIKLLYLFRQVLKIRKMDKAAREEMEEMVELYCQALGMLGAHTQAKNMANELEDAA
jgi:hypothetical protein